MAKTNPILQKKVASTYLRKAGLAVLWSVCIFVVYALSLGPAVKLSGWETSAGKAGLPRWIKIVYWPMLNSNLGPLEYAYDHYLQLWEGVK